MISLFITSTQSHWEKQQHCFEQLVQRLSKRVQFTEQQLSKMVRTIWVKLQIFKYYINRSQILLTSCHLIIIVDSRAAVINLSFSFELQVPCHLVQCSVMDYTYIRALQIDVNIYVYMHICTCCGTL